MPSISETPTESTARASVNSKTLLKVRFDNDFFKNSQNDAGSEGRRSGKITARSDDVSTCADFEGETGKEEPAVKPDNTKISANDTLTVYTLGGEEVIIKGTEKNPFNTLTIEDACKVVADFLTRKRAHEGAKTARENGNSVTGNKREFNSLFNNSECNFITSDEETEYFSVSSCTNSYSKKMQKVEPLSSENDLDNLYDLTGSCVANLDALLENDDYLSIPIPANLVSATVGSEHFENGNSDGCELVVSEENHLNGTDVDGCERNTNKKSSKSSPLRQSNNSPILTSSSSITLPSWKYSTGEVKKNVLLKDIANAKLCLTFVALPAAKALERTEFSEILAHAMPQKTNRPSLNIGGENNDNTQNFAENLNANFYNGPRFFTFGNNENANGGDNNNTLHHVPNNNNHQNNQNRPVVHNNTTTTEFKTVFAAYATSVKCNLDLVEKVSSLDKKLQQKKLLELLYVAPEEILFRSRQGFFLALLQNLWRDQGGLGTTSTARSRLSFWGTCAAGVDLDCVKLFFNFWRQKMGEIGMMGNGGNCNGEDNLAQRTLTDVSGKSTNTYAYVCNMDSATSRMESYVDTTENDNVVSQPATAEWRELLDKLVSALVLKVPEDISGKSSCGSREFYFLTGGANVVGEKNEEKGENEEEPVSAASIKKQPVVVHASTNDSNNFNDETTINQPPAFHTGLNLFTELVKTMPQNALPGNEEEHSVLKEVCLCEEDEIRGKSLLDFKLDGDKDEDRLEKTASHQIVINEVDNITEKGTIISETNNTPSVSNIAAPGSTIAGGSSSSSAVPENSNLENQNTPLSALTNTENKHVFLDSTTNLLQPFENNEEVSDEEGNENEDEDEEDEPSSENTSPASSLASSSRAQIFDNTFVFRNVARNLLSNFFILGKAQNASDANSTMLLQRVSRLNQLLQAMRESGKFNSVENLRYLFMTKFSFHPFPRPFMKNERLVDFARYLLLFCRERRDSETGLCELSRNTRNREQNLLEDSDDEDENAETVQAPAENASSSKALEPAAETAGPAASPVPEKNSTYYFTNADNVGPMDIKRGFGSKKEVPVPPKSPLSGGISPATNEKTARQLLDGLKHSKSSIFPSTEDQLFRKVRLECLKTCVLLIRWRAEYRKAILRGEENGLED